jgi:autotransporter-associated beta strand protein
MKSLLILLLVCAAGMQPCAPARAIQPSVYSGVFAFASGDLNTLAKQQTITNFVADAQSDVSIINMFNSWTSGSSTNGTASFPTASFDYIRAHGSIPLFSWQPHNSSLGVTQSFTLASISGGAYDTYIANWAAAAKNWGHPFFLRLAHEMNGNWYPWCAGVNGNTATQYVTMWRHVHDVFASVGVTNATWVWCVNTAFSTSTPIHQLYPGDNYVDWISVDGYNRLANSWQDFSTLAAVTVTQLTNIAPGKPIMVAETGCNQNPNFDKGQWFLNALTNYLPSVQPRIKAWVYFNSTNTSDGNEWRITVPAGAESGYRQGIALPYYASNQYGTVTTIPIQPLLNDAMAVDTMAPFVSIVNPATSQATNGIVVSFLASASDKSGISRVIYAVNGVARQTNLAAPYQFSWTVPMQGPQTYAISATAFDNAGNSAPSTVYLISQGPTNILQTASESSPMDWNSAIWGTPVSVPTAANNYETPNGFAVRTPNLNSGGAGAFAGNTLQIDSGGVLYLKHNNIIETANLVLNGGEIRYHGAPGGTNSPLAGTVQVSANSMVTSDQNGGAGAANVNIWLLSALSGAGNLTLAQDTATNSVVILGNNSGYAGNWTNTGGFVEIGSGAINPLGSGMVRLVNSGNHLDFNCTNDLVINNVIAGAGSVVKKNSGTITLPANNTFTGNLNINAGTLALSGSIGGAARIALASGAVLNAAAAPGGLTIGGAQALTGIGSVSGDITVSGTLSPGPLGAMNFADGLALLGTTIMEINRTNLPASDVISAAMLELGGTLTVTNIGPPLQAGDSFQLFSSSITGAFAGTNLPALSSMRLAWDASKLNTQGILSVALNPAVAPTILAPLWDGTNLRLQVNSQTGFDYVLQATPQLMPANWLATQTNSGGGLVTFTIPTKASTQQFFRISVQ